MSNGVSDDRVSLAAVPKEFVDGAAQWSARAVRALMTAGHPLYASVTKETIYEDGRTSASAPRGAGPVDTTPHVGDPASLGHRELAAEYEWVLDQQEVLSFDVGRFLALLLGAADAFASQLTRGILTHLSDVSEAHGNVVNAAGRDFAEVMLEMLEGMDYSFNESGEPNLTLVIHPDQLAKLQGVKFTPEQQLRHDEIVKRKREVWNATQRRRELPGLID